MIFCFFCLLSKRKYLFRTVRASDYDLKFFVEMTNATPTAYNIVCVGLNLPKVDKKYPFHTAENLPPPDFWTSKLGPNDHVMANGPRKL